MTMHAFQRRRNEKVVGIRKQNQNSVKILAGDHASGYFMTCRSLNLLTTGSFDANPPPLADAVRNFPHRRVFVPEKARVLADPSNMKVVRDIPFVADGDAAQKLDLYLPATTGKRPQPLLIWIHGGGWQGGSKSGCRFSNQVAREYVVASIEYRFSQKAKFPAQIQDCQAAIRWLRANSAKYNIDPEHVGVGGDSAGGHLVALLGTSGGQKAFPAVGGNDGQTDRVQAVCDFYGPADFFTVVEQANADKTTKNIFTWNSGDPYSQLIGAKVGEDKSACEAVSPTHYVSKNSAPILILHGDHDSLGASTRRASSWPTL